METQRVYHIQKAKNGPAGSGKQVPWLHKSVRHSKSSMSSFLKLVSPIMMGGGKNIE